MKNPYKKMTTAELQKYAMELEGSIESFVDDAHSRETYSPEDFMLMVAHSTGKELTAVLNEINSRYTLIG